MKNTIRLSPLCALLMYPLWKQDTPGAWTFAQTTLFAFSLLLMHIWLDCVTTYGTLAFLPFSDYRVRLNGLFIIDLWLLIPLIAACFAARRCPRAAALAMIWLLLYSSGAVAWRMNLQNKWNSSLRKDGVAAEQLSVLPDAFAPLYWKVQYEHDGWCHTAPLAWNGLRVGPWRREKSADPTLLARLASEDRSACVWTSFSVMHLQEEQNWEGGREYSFHDWRLDSFVPLIQNRRGNAPFFKLMARVDDTGKLAAVRVVTGGKDSGWQPPAAPKGRSGINRLIGLDD